MGTLSKAIGSVGGYVAGSKTLIDFLKIEQDLLFLILHYQLRLYQQV